MNTESDSAGARVPGNRAGTIGRLMAELSVIVLGVLLAFAADRWNQGRADREAAADYSERLMAELTADSVRLEGERQGAVQAGDAGIALLHSLSADIAADTLVRARFFGCMRNAPLPYSGGSTFQEITGTGSLRLLPAPVRQTLFEYYGWVDATLLRLHDMRRLDRDPLLEAGNRSGAFVDHVSAGEFSERLREYPDIRGLVSLCVAYQRGTSEQIVSWLSRLARVLQTLRSAQAP